MIEMIPPQPPLPTSQHELEQLARGNPELVISTDHLSAQTSSGGAKHWIGLVTRDANGNHYTQSLSWTTKQDGSPSQKKLSEPALVEGKNIGKSNETNPYQQAVSECEARRTKKIDSGYQTASSFAAGEIKAGAFPILPQLAHSLADKQHKLEFPCYVQPKFNGMRLLWSQNEGAWTRQNRQMDPSIIAHITPPFYPLDNTTIFDGELILPDGYSFQDTMRAVKKYTPGLTEKLVYRIYDVYLRFDPDLDFDDRLEELHDLWSDLDDHDQDIPNFEKTNCIKTETYLVVDMAELYANHKEFTDRGYEGTMIRMPGAVYTPGHRSTGLLKLKDFQDAEFEVIGFEDGRGKEAGAVIWVCRTAAGAAFSVRPEGGYESRREQYLTANHRISSSLTVRFQEYSKDGVPIFPVGVGFSEDRQPA
jgi:DNA ligase 1